MATVFTEMLAGNLPAWPVAEDEKHIAFLEAKPSAYGHVICLPKQEVADLFAMDENSYLELMRFCKQVAGKLQAVIPCQKIGMTVIGLKTLHAHVHLIPLNTMDDILFKNEISVDDDYFNQLQTLLRSCLE